MFVKLGHSINNKLVTVFVILRFKLVTLWV